MSNNAVDVIAHRDAAWQRAFRIYLRADGRLLALGREPLRAAAVRIFEEGLGNLETTVTCLYEEGGMVTSGKVRLLIGSNLDAQAA